MNYSRDSCFQRRISPVPACQWIRNLAVKSNATHLFKPCAISFRTDGVCLDNKRVTSYGTNNIKKKTSRPTLS